MSISKVKTASRALSLFLLSQHSRSFTPQHLAPRFGQGAGRAFDTSIHPSCTVARHTCTSACHCRLAESPSPVAQPLRFFKVTMYIADKGDDNKSDRSGHYVYIDVTLHSKIRPGPLCVRAGTPPGPDSLEFVTIKVSSILNPQTFLQLSPSSNSN